MKYIYILIIAFLTFAGTANAQIKIGNTSAPEKFSILEIDALKTGETATNGRIIGGLRLPQWENGTVTSMIPTLTANAEAKGLLVYNKDEQYIQMWNGTKWIALPTEGCTAVQTLTLAANQTTLDEYGAQDLVLTATPDAGVSDNADIVYRWTLDANPIEGATGSTYTVKKENLSATHGGVYQVTAYSCGFTGTIQDVSSNTINVIVTPKTYSITVTPVTPNVAANSEELLFTCNVSNFVPTNLAIVEDTEHMYDNVFAVFKDSDTQYSVVMYYRKNDSNRSQREMKFRIIDDMGNASDVITITQGAYTLTASDVQVGTYLLYGESTSQSATDAMEHCRSKVWTAPKRTSLMSMAFLDENKATLEATQSIVPSGDYWISDTGVATKINIDYPAGVLTITPNPGEAQANTHTTRCIAPF